MILSLTAFILRIAVLVVFTFAFVVLYEHGPSRFFDGAREEAARLTSLIDQTSATPAPKQ